MAAFEAAWVAHLAAQPLEAGWTAADLLRALPKDTPPFRHDDMVPVLERVSALQAKTGKPIPRKLHLALAAAGFRSGPGKLWSRAAFAAAAAGGGGGAPVAAVAVAPLAGAAPAQRAGLEAALLTAIAAYLGAPYARPSARVVEAVAALAASLTAGNAEGSAAPGPVAAPASCAAGGAEPAFAARARAAISGDAAAVRLDGDVLGAPEMWLLEDLLQERGTEPPLRSLDLSRTGLDAKLAYYACALQRSFRIGTLILGGNPLISADEAARMKSKVAAGLEVLFA